MKRSKKKTLRVFNRFSGLPKILIWGWTIWSAAVVATLLILYAPPFHSVKKTVISQIASFTTPDKKIEPESEIKLEKKSDLPISPLSAGMASDENVPLREATKPKEKFDIAEYSSNHPAPAEQKPTIPTTLPVNPGSSVAIRSPGVPPLFETPPALDLKKSDDTGLVKVPSIDSEISNTTSADLKFFRSHPDAISHSTATATENKKVAEMEKVANADPNSTLKTNQQEDTVPIIPKPNEHPGIILVMKKQPDIISKSSEVSKPLADTPAMQPINKTQVVEPETDKARLLPKTALEKPEPDSETALLPVEIGENHNPPAANEYDSHNGKNVRGEIETDIQRFTTYDRQRHIAEWEKLKFKGVDQHERSVEMALLVLSDKFYWRFGGQSVINSDNRAIRIVEHLASEALKIAISDSNGIVSIGTASEEGDLRLEEYRAKLRSERLMSLVIQTQPQINAIYTLCLGQYQKTVTSLGPSSNDQRRIILISITQQDLNADLAEAIKNGLSTIPGLPYELRHFSSFELKNNASAF